MIRTDMAFPALSAPWACRTFQQDCLCIPDVYQKQDAPGDRGETAQRHAGVFRPGSGFKIAMKDLELRGAGNLLGAQQHGHMNAVGYDLYCKMLSEAVKEAKGIRTMDDFETTIDLNIDAFIPDSYIGNEFQKLDIYKRIAGIESQQEYDDMLEELIDRFGEPTKAVLNLLAIARLKALAHQGYVTEIKQLGKDVRITLYEKAKLDPAGIRLLWRSTGEVCSLRLIMSRNLS